MINYSCYLTYPEGSYNSYYTHMFSIASDLDPDSVEFLVEVVLDQLGSLVWQWFKDVGLTVETLSEDGKSHVTVATFGHDDPIWDEAERRIVEGTFQYRFDPEQGRLVRVP